ncbi:MAG TPA: flavodoxin family protein [bacterium (Candidatus Stahlbacteria)]|nr:flavodoxin family protein [Candidatus Stahlbacteria bacterium]
MANLLIVYHSCTGNTEKMAKAVAEGAKEIREVEVFVKKYNEATNDDLLNASGIIIGSPTYFRQMSAELKSFIDKSIDVYGKLKGKIGGVFTSTGTTSDGEKCLTSLYEALDCHGVNVIGKVLSVEAPGTKELEACRNLGRGVAKRIIE